jgi:uncharacterized protein YggT (Ycf19 family)
MDKVNIIQFVANFILIFKNLVVYAIIARVIVSWIFVGRPVPEGGLVGFLNDVTRPFIRLAKKIPHRVGMLDLSSLIALLGVDLIGQLLANLLYNLI